MLRFEYLNHVDNEIVAITVKQSISLYSLCLEEFEFMKLSNLGSSHLTKSVPLSVYSKINPFGLNFKKYFKFLSLEDGATKILNDIIQYRLMLFMNKKNEVLGYISYDISEIKVMNKIKKVILIYHMYISNALCTTEIDKKAFSELKKCNSESIIFSYEKYKCLNEFRGYSDIYEPFSSDKLIGVISLTKFDWFRNEE